MTELVATLRARSVRNPDIVDGLLATGLLLGAALGLTHDVGSEIKPPDAATYLLIGAGLLPFYLRRRAPMVVFSIACVPLLVLIWTGRTTSTLGVGMFLLAYTVAAHRGRRDTVIAGIVIASTLVLFRLRAPERLDIAELVTNSILFGAAFVMGRWAQASRRYTGWMEERARLLAREGDQLARMAVTEERLRISRELHDILGHSLGIIAVQAGVGERLLHRDPARAGDALSTIGRVSRDSLNEIRALVVGLRSEDEDTGRPPVPSLAAIDDLVEQRRAAGAEVTLSSRGLLEEVGVLQPGGVRVPHGVQLAAYRVVQEGLTNVQKHAPGVGAHVEIDCVPERLTIQVTNTRPASATTVAAAPGHGVIGLGERVRAWGGDLQAAPMPDGGFMLVAHFPLAPAGATTDVQARA